MKKKKRDIEKAYTKRELIMKLHRLTESLETGKSFTIQVAGERISIPKDALVNIEHERHGKNEELEFQIKWKN